MPHPICLALCAQGLSVAAVAAPTPVDGAVADADDLAPFFEAAATRRVDIVGIGDSNQLFQSHGWDEGWILALDARFDTYATSLLSLGENSGFAMGAGAGFRVFSSRSGNAFTYAGAPEPLDDMLKRVPGFAPMGYLYIEAAATRTITNHGVRVSPNGPIATSAPLTFSSVSVSASAASTSGPDYSSVFKKVSGHSPSPGDAPDCPRLPSVLS